MASNVPVPRRNPFREIIDPTPPSEFQKKVATAKLTRELGIMNAKRQPDKRRRSTDAYREGLDGTVGTMIRRHLGKLI